MAREPGHYALVIGIDDYPGFRSLQGAQADAKRVHDWLIDDDEGGGLDASHAKLLLSNRDPASPLQPQIDAALAQLFQTPSASPLERFYFYFSGHGFGVAPDDVALCLVNWSNLFRNAAISSRDYRNLIVGSGKYPELVLWFDCCRLTKVRVAGMGPSLGWAREGGGHVRCFEGFATEFQNAAFEAEVHQDLSAHAQPEVRGHFTRALLDALGGAAAGAHGGVLATDLKVYLEREVPRLAQAAGHQQKPAVSNGLPADATFGAATPGANVTIHFSPNRHGIIALEPPVGEQPIRRDDASTGPWTLPLGRGNHRLVEEQTGQDAFFRVIAVEGAMRVDF